MTGIVEVAAAVLLREGANGTEYLLAQRPPDKVYAGYWEFPGGKVEAGETLREALVREIQEELGVTVDNAWPWLTRQFTYPHATVRLKFFHVTSWHGEIRAIEHSGIVWVKIGDTPPVSPVLPANGPILRGLELPRVCQLIEIDSANLNARIAEFDSMAACGKPLIRVACAKLTGQEKALLASHLAPILGKSPTTILLIDDDEALARMAQASGVFFSGETGNPVLSIKQRPDFEWVAASCRNQEELAHAIALDLDFVVVPNVRSTTDSRGGSIGWGEFGRLIELSPLPVLAQGSIAQESLETAQAQGGHGIVIEA